MFKKGDKVEVYRNQHNLLYFPNVNKGFKGTIDYVVHDEQDPTNYARVTGFTRNDGFVALTTYIKLPYLKRIK